MRDFYSFLFYCFYILDRFIPPKWLSEYKAAFVLTIIGFINLFTIYGIVDVLFFHVSPLSESILDFYMYFIPGIFYALNWAFFLKDDKWKIIIKKYDSESFLVKRRKYIIVATFLSFSIGLLLLMLYFLNLKYNN